MSDAVRGPMFKGGGYSPGIRHMIGAPARHHYWTGTTDEPRSLVPPSDGGLDKPPNSWKRFTRWLSYYLRWGRPALLDRHSADARKQREVRK